MRAKRNTIAKIIFGCKWVDIMKYKVDRFINKKVDWLSNNILKFMRLISWNLCSCDKDEHS